MEDYNSNDKNKQNKDQQKDTTRNSSGDEIANVHALKIRLLHKFRHSFAFCNAGLPNLAK